ncbi:hypothetical protein JZK55_11190 [Dissulfurispira thermophila]|uniref:DUF1640 domain-containing protein n=1 Tax=Dissulfurispira thermophila TaxID=2715679 RepID=A0A7G1H396_9BACT|nr:hypothetical protein [Dissulfurispira thermophila]BCB96197.1 hypothetical protein JZK55_11190 [Dissulfurispira thermophila]
MAATISIKLYEILEAKLGKEEAKEVVNALEEVTRSLAKESKLEVKDELKSELITKTEFREELKALLAEFRMYFIILVCIIILLNPKAIDLIAKFLGVMK